MKETMGQNDPEEPKNLKKVAGKYKELFEFIPSPTAVFDVNGMCYLANHAFSNLLGHTRIDLLDGRIKFVDLFFNQVDASEVVSELQERRVIRRREVRIKDNKGDEIQVLFSGRTLELEGRPSFDVTLTDITRQKRLERIFRRDHARMVSLIESLTAGLFLVNNKGKISEFNLSLMNLIGLDQETVIGEPYQQFLNRLLSGIREPEVAQKALSQAVNAVSERPIVELVRQGEQEQNIEVALFPVWDEDGSSLGWGGLVQDVTETRNRLAWKLELLSILAHDIRTPLATLKGHVTALLANHKHWGEDMLVEFLEAIDRGTDNLVRQVERSLALTRVEAGRLGLRPESVDPKELIQRAIERAASSLKNTSVEFQLHPELSKVRADPARVEEVLVNLLDNAARFSPANEPITIRAWLEGPRLYISVTDKGLGVPQDKQQMIFEKFARGHNGDRGTGLGLFISRKIVEAHGGRIGVKSPPEGEQAGAQFYFTLPLTPQPTRTKPKTSSSALAATKPISEGSRVLVVEDEPDFQALLRTIFIEAGYNVEIAPNGPSAVDIVQTSQPDIILLDWILPGMDGISVCRNIRRWSSVPILMITSKTSQEDLITAMDAGADDYVTKPFHTPELLARTRALLRRGDMWVEEGPDRFSAQGLLINFDSQEVWLADEKIELTPTEFNLISYLAKNKGQVLTYDLLLNHLYGMGKVRNRHDLFVHISRLRKKIEPDPKEPNYVVTRWGVGYIFMP
ncbi:MAG: response regulator [Chloroflexi bacterium]|nr:response regulator [Chloroflexota bacterium]